MFKPGELKDRATIKEALRIMRNGFQEGLDAIKQVDDVVDTATDEVLEKEFIYMIHRINSLESKFTS